MVTDSQKAILESWEDCTDQRKKDRIKESLSSSLSDIYYLSKLSADESRQVVQNAMENVWNLTEELDNREDYITKSKFVRIIFRELFNGFEEARFNSGVNNGIQDAVERRCEEGDIYACFLKAHLKITQGGSLHQRHPIEERNINLSAPPADPIEFFRRLLILENGVHPSEDELYLLTTFFGDLDGEEYINKNAIDIVSSSEDPHVSRVAGLVKTAVRSKKKAETIALILQNPANDFESELDVESMSFERQLEYLQVHRADLEKSGRLPSDHKIPNAEELAQNVRNPALLNLNHWELDSNRDG